MSHIVKLSVVANPNTESEEVRDAIFQRATARPVHVTLVEPAAGDAGPPCAAGPGVTERARDARAARLQRAVVRLHDAGVALEGLAPAGVSAQDAGVVFTSS